MEEAEADTTKAAAEEDHDVNLDHSLKDGEVDKVSNPTQQRRKTKQTERGAAYQRDLLISSYKSRKAGVLKQINAIESSLQTPDNMDAIKEKDQQMDKAFEEVLETLGRLRDAEISEDYREELARDIEKVDASIFSVKRKISHVEARIPKLEDERSARSRSSRTRSSRTHSARSERSCSSSVKQKALILGLEAKRKAMLNTQKAEAEMAEAQAELEAETAKLLKENNQELELLKIDEEIAKAKAVENIYKEEEATAPEASNHSQSSRVSRRSSIAQKAKVAGLIAEKEAKMKTQEAEAKIQRIKEEHETELKRKLKAAKQKIELLKLDEQLAEARAVEQCMEDGGEPAYEEPNKIETQGLAQENLEDQAKMKEKTDKYDQQKESNLKMGPIAEAKIPPQCTKSRTLTNTGCEDQLAKLLSKIVKLQAAPDVEIDVFSGDPLEYTYFIKNFKDIIETTVDSQSGRLNRLIKYTDGEAKELIKHCVHEDKGECYNRALELLEKEYGNKFKLSCAFMEQLRTWPTLKQNDAPAFKKFYRFLLKCQTLRKNGELEVLDSPLSIRQIQLKLPASQQDRWSKIVEQTRRTDGREARFQDFVSFVDFENSVINDPVYSRCTAPEKKPLHVNTSGVKDINVDKAEKCVGCGLVHDLDVCEKFLGKSIEEKKDFLKKEKLCFACFKPGHISRGCINRRKCNVCAKNHPTSMHVYTDTNVLSTGVKEHRIVAMCIVPVMVHHTDNPDKEFKVYAIVDNCSQGTFGTNDLLFNKLGIVGRKTSLSMETALVNERINTFAVDGLVVRCIDQHKLQYSNSFEVKLPTTYSRESLPADKNDVASKNNVLSFKHLKDVAKHIPEFDEEIPIGLLIGQDCPRAQEPHETIHGVENEPYAVRKVLGWCVMGPITEELARNAKCNFLKTRYAASSIDSQTTCKNHFAFAKPVQDNYVSDKLREMWSSDFNETNGDAQALSMEDKQFVQLMQSNVKQVDGKYELPLPLKDEKNLDASKSRQMAISRIRGIKRKLQANAKFKADYCGFMSTLLEKGYARKCRDNTSGAWYIPHHGVYHPTKKKIRVVFDCSAQVNGVSLNDILLQGPDLTNSLVGVLMRFRLQPVAVMGDIEAMFYQVTVPESHRKYLRFFWWPEDNFDIEPQEYEMCVHLFGALSSPSCANFALRQAAKDNEDSFGQECADVLRRNFYVDDMLKSYPDEKSAKENILQVEEMCKRGGFNLTKFVSNSKQVMSAIQTDKHALLNESPRICESKLSVERALGVNWCVEHDQFGFRVMLNDTPLTRRAILSSISSIYDPLGLISPFLLKGRKILQEITSEKDSHWDDELKDDHIQAWRDWRESLFPLRSLRLDRCYKPNDFGDSIETTLHCFSDACQYGYGAACYLRQVNEDGKVHVSLVMGKSRVSPIKYTTIPRLELTASTVSARLGVLIKAEISVIQSINFWVDSQIVLGYIKNESRRFKIFVANRTQIIRDLTDKDSWKYVDTENNPSDVASRGLTCEDKNKMDVWFKGPSFLWNKEEDWNISQPEQVITVDTDPEIKPTLRVNTIVVPAKTVLDSLEERVSDWNKMRRIMAQVIRFNKICRKQVCSKATRLQVEEVEGAEKIMIRMAQEKYFSEKISKSRWLATLNPFKDTDGLLKVGGRLKNSSQPKQIKFPIILPKRAMITQRLIEWYHGKVQHSGRTTTLNEIRSHGYWIIGMNSRVKSVIHACIRCRTLRGRLADQKMADLPIERTLELAPFTYCGVDMFGHFNIKEGRKIHKRYCVLFTCFSSRAVHLETTNTLDTDSFIMALRRFLSTRGKVRSIRSDNGGNFVGAGNELRNCLKEMDTDKISNYLLTETCDWIDWEKNTPRASHMGGVWERQIRTIRSILISLLKSHDSVLNSESFNTLVKEVECIVNSRPLDVQNINDPDSELLTPNHLLTLKSKVVLPPPGVFQKDDLYCRRRWRVIQHLANEFWDRWRKEYLTNLQERKKWTEEKRNFQVGDIVLLKEDNVVRNLWPSARVTEVFPNQDGLVRSVQLLVVDKSGKTHSAKRPIAKLVLICEATHNNVRTNDEDEAQNTTATTEQPTTPAELEFEEARLFNETREEELRTESTNPSLPGIVNSNTTAEKQIASTEKQLTADSVKRSVPKALKRLISFNKPGNKE